MSCGIYKNPRAFLRAGVKMSCDLPLVLGPLKLGRLIGRLGKPQLREVGEEHHVEDDVYKKRPPAKEEVQPEECREKNENTDACLARHCASEAVWE